MKVSLANPPFGAISIRTMRPVYLLVYSCTAFAATIPGSFQQINFDGGGWFEQIIPHSSGRLYGRTDVGGIYRSDNHGDSWQFLSGSFTNSASYFVQGVAVEAGNANVVYQAVGTSYASAESGRGVWKSTDGGTAWTQVLPAVNFSGNDEPRWGGECLTIQPGNDAEVWAGSRGDGLRRSTDSGANWTNVSPATFDTPNVVICGVTVHPSAPDHIWVCGEGGVWVSVNHGTSWTKKITATRIYRVVRKADGTTFAAGVNSGANVLYRITATDWANPATYTSTNINPNYVAALPYAPSGDMATVQVMANGDLWAADLYEFTCKSTNNGSTFTRMPMTLSGPLTGWTLPGTTTMQGGRNSIIQDSALPTRMFLGGGYAPYRSDDSGATWRFIANGVGETVAWRACFHPTDGNRVWLPIADLGATTVSDSGTSGVSTGYIAPHFPYPDDNVTFSHRMLISAGKVIAPGGEQSTHKARIYQTTNNGASWTKLAATGLPTANDREIIDAVASSDNPDDFLVFCSGTTGVGAGGIYRTTNGGANFTQATGITAGKDTGNLFYWHPTLERDASNVAVRYLFLRNVGFFKSTDRGATWTKPAAQPRDTYAKMHVDGVTGRIWVGTEFGTGFDYSDNGGTSWTATSTFTSVTEFDCHGSRIAAIGTRTGDTFNKLYYSADNGVTWNEISRPDNRFAVAQAVAVDPWRPGTVWISTNGRAVSRFTPWTPIEIWRNTNLGSPTADDLANADSDTFPNLVEYALGTNPNAHTTPLAAEVQTIGPAKYTALRVNRDAIHAGVSYSVEASSDLVNWSSSGLVTIANTDTLLQVRDNVAIDTPGQEKRFLRLKITLL